jgi:hypothetical protein
MIVIFTSRDDQSTNEVIDWLYHFKAKFIRVNEDDVISQYSLLLNNQGDSYELKVTNGDTWSGKAASLWYRRGGFNLSPIVVPVIEGLSRAGRAEIQRKRVCLHHIPVRVPQLDNSFTRLEKEVHEDSRTEPEQQKQGSSLTHRLKYMLLSPYTCLKKGSFKSLMK